MECRYEKCTKTSFLLKNDQIVVMSNKPNKKTPYIPESTDIHDKDQWIFFYC